MQHMVKMLANRASKMTGRSAPSAAAAWPDAKLPKKPIALAVAHRIARRWAPWLFPLLPLATTVIPNIMAKTATI